MTPPLISTIESPRVAIQGDDRGSFHAVTSRHLSLIHKPILVPCVTFEEAHGLMIAGEVDFALTAIDNTIDGQVQPSMQELLRNKDAYVVEMVRTGIRQFLIGHTNLCELDILQGLGDNLRIISHPKALGQGRERARILLPKAELTEHYDTAGAVRKVTELAGKPDRHGLSYIAIAGRAALLEYVDNGAKLVTNSPVSPDHNYTTFALLSPEPRRNPNATDTALYITQKEDKLGSLEEILRLLRVRQFDIRHPFRRRELNLNRTVIDSLSEATKEPSYSFYVNVAAPLQHPDLQTAIAQLERAGNLVRIIGSYSIKQVDDPDIFSVTV